MERKGLILFAYSLVAVVMTPAQAAATEVVLHNFGCPPRGASPYSGVIRDTAGNFYGTTYTGGTANKGVVYRVSPSGHQTVLYNFTGGADGGAPYAGVIRDSAGNLYGTTYSGGAANAGVVYKVDSAGHETVLYSFTGGDDGANPYAGVIRDSAGNLYGTTYQGGTQGAGLVYKLDTNGHETVLSSFAYTNGNYPEAGLIRDSAGNLYGTTTQGGPDFKGVVYMWSTTGHETVLWGFSGADGGSPIAGVIRDSAGNLYGTDYQGGAANAGAVYKLDTTGHETVLHRFTGAADGGNPYAGLIQDSAGNLYGTTSAGGRAGHGVVYKLDASGNETVLYSFTGGADGGNPYAALIRDSAGDLYGTTSGGGTAGAGVIYKLDPSGNETVLYSFPGAAGGSEPLAGLIRDSAGNLYGTTQFGGSAGAGTVYKLDTSAHEIVLYTFTGGADGANPRAGLVRGSAGNFYGTTYYGGAAGAGTVYKLDTTGHETVLYSFTGAADGGYPAAGVVFDSDGNLYGTTLWGGTSGVGVVYKLDTAGQETVLHNFTGGADGRFPESGVVFDSAGNLYGTTCEGGAGGAGIVYKLDTSDQLTPLYSFTGGADGGYTGAGVIRDSAGNLYGTTPGGGIAGQGVVYKLDASGTETVLYRFTGGADGGTPVAGVVRDSAGNLYGTTEYGAVAGVVFELNASGQETVLHSFTGGADGSNPVAGVIRDSAGNLYGTTEYGGTKGSGVVFKIKP